MSWKKFARFLDNRWIKSTWHLRVFAPRALTLKVKMKFTLQSVAKPHIQICIFFPVHWLTKLFSFGNKTITLCLRKVTRVPPFLWKYARFLMPLSPLPPTSTVSPPSHGDVGRLSLLASRPAVWDVLPALQSGGKWWQAYLPWRSLTWKKREYKKKKEAEGVHSIAEHLLPELKPSREKKHYPFHEFVSFGIKSVL